MNRIIKQGFTLIELSIMLVIIALLAGGIVAGKELINASIIRSQIKQLQNYQTAFMTFKGKYGCYAGDCPNGDVLFGLDPDDNGDGNGLVEFRDYVDGKPYGYNQVFPAPGQPNYGDYLARMPRWSDSSSGAAHPSPEPKYALIQLSEAYLVEDVFDDTWPSGGRRPAGNGMAAMKYDKSRGFFIGSHHNFYRANVAPNYPNYQVAPGNYIWMIDAIKHGYTGSIIAFYDLHSMSVDGKAGLFKPIDAKSIDNKIDDGMPLTGKFLALQPTFHYWNLGANPTCIEQSTADYRLINDFPVCIATYRID